MKTASNLHYLYGSMLHNSPKARSYEAGTGCSV
jgi:hypothetical protein